MIQFFLFIIGFIIMTIGFTLLIIYLNYGYTFHEYISYVSRRISFYLPLLGLLLIIISIKKKRK